MPIEPFTISVSESGLPHWHCPPVASGNESLKNLSALQCSQLYWLLESIDLRYHYEVSGNMIYREKTLRSSLRGIERGTSAPVFRYAGIEDGIEIAMALHLDLLAQSGPGQYALDFEIFESDELGSYELIFGSSPGFHLISERETTFLGSSLRLRLYAQEAKTTGKIHDFTLKAKFYEVKQPPRIL